jgi:MFS transporter, CP family, cyanate transporter
MQVALMTSIYSTTMGIFAATASGLSVPIAEGLHLGWQVALIVWAIPALLGIIVWIYLAKQSTDHYRVSYQPIIEQKQIWRSPLAWQVAAFMGFQSFLFLRYYFLDA